MEMIEAFCRMGYERDVWKNTAISFECQLYFADPKNATFANYTKDKLEVMNNTVERWKSEIESAKKTTEEAIKPLKMEIVL